MKGSGPQGLSRVRPHRSKLPADEDRNSVLYTEGIEDCSYESSSGYGGDVYCTVDIPGRDVTESGYVDFGRPVRVRQVTPSYSSEEFQWSNDGVRWYEVNAIYHYVYWPHVYDDADTLMMRGGTIWARYWRTVRRVPGNPTLAPYPSYRRWYFEQERDSDIVYDHSKHNYTSIDNWDNSHYYMMGRYIHTGAMPEMGLSLLLNHDYHGASRFFSFDPGLLQYEQHRTDYVETKWQFQQIRKQGLVTGQCMWGDGSGYYREQPWHPNSFFWTGYSLTANAYNFYVFKTCLPAGVQVLRASPNVTKIPHSFGKIPDCVICTDGGAGVNEAYGYNMIVMSASRPTKYFDGMRAQSNEQDRDNGKGFDVDNEYVYVEDTSRHMFILCLDHRTDKTINFHTGTYAGNGSSSGASVNMGFRPSVTIVWPIDYISTGQTALWFTYSNKAYDMGNDRYVSEAAYDLTHTATGFDITGTDHAVNQDGATYFYMSFGGYAESWPP